MDAGLHIVESAIGPLGLAWMGQRLQGLQLPEADHAATVERLRSRYPDHGERAPPVWLGAVVRSLRRLCEGAPADFGASPELDLDRYTAFERAVWEITRRTPFGQTTTYGEIARTLGDVGRARAVGAALGANPVPIIVPCHRVLGADGRVGGFSGAGGVAAKLRLLNIERATTSPEPLLFDSLPLAQKSRTEN